MNIRQITLNQKYFGGAAVVILSKAASAFSSCCSATSWAKCAVIFLSASALPGPLPAKTFFAGGLLGLIAVFLHAPFWVAMAGILVAALVPAFYSLVLYKQLERHGNL